MLIEFKESAIINDFINKVVIPNYKDNLKVVLNLVAEERGGKVNKGELINLISDMASNIPQALHLIFDTIYEAESFAQKSIEIESNRKMLLDLQERSNNNYLTDTRLLKVIGLNRS